VTLLDSNDWKVMMGGFVEIDGITDSTRSFREVIGNAPVSVSTKDGAGGNGRTQFSIRNSRLGFTVQAPEFDGWATKGYLEFDFLGYDTQNTSDSATVTSANQSESSFFTSPTMRIRHAYIQAEKDDFQVLAGQYWNLFGWQPYYFMTTVDVAPLSGMLYSRNPQLRVLKAIKFSDQDVLQVAAALVRPPQEDSRLPSLEAGVRYAMGERSSGFTGSSSGPRQTQPMSIGVSGTAREFSVPVSGSTSSNSSTDESYAGYALAADAMIPVLASPDGKEVANTLSLLGEFTIGSGDGDLFNGWTGGSANPLNASPNAPSNTTYMDAGIGDYDPSGSFHLMHVQTFNVHAQYHLPTAFNATWLDAGYGQLFSNNVGELANSSGNIPGSGNLAYDKERVIFGNVFHDFTPHLRAAIEYARVETDYVAGFSAIDNRVQVSAWFLF
jgi:hypothetical protein